MNGFLQPDSALMQAAGDMGIKLTPYERKSDVDASHIRFLLHACSCLEHLPDSERSEKIWQLAGKLAPSDKALYFPSSLPGRIPLSENPDDFIDRLRKMNRHTWVSVLTIIKRLDAQVYQFMLGHSHSPFAGYRHFAGLHGSVKNLTDFVHKIASQAIASRKKLGLSGADLPEREFLYRQAWTDVHIFIPENVRSDPLIIAHFDAFVPLDESFMPTHGEYALNFVPPYLC